MFFRKRPSFFSNSWRIPYTCKEELWTFDTTLASDFLSFIVACESAQQVIEDNVRHDSSLRHDKACASLDWHSHDWSMSTVSNQTCCHPFELSSVDFQN